MQRHTSKYTARARSIELQPANCSQVTHSLFGGERKPAEREGRGLVDRRTRRHVPEGEEHVAVLETICSKTCCSAVQRWTHKQASTARKSVESTRIELARSSLVLRRTGLN